MQILFTTPGLIDVYIHNIDYYNYNIRFSGLALHFGGLFLWSLSRAANPRCVITVFENTTIIIVVFIIEYRLSLYTHSASGNFLLSPVKTKRISTLSSGPPIERPQMEQRIELLAAVILLLLTVSNPSAGRFRVTPVAILLLLLFFNVGYLCHCNYNCPTGSNNTCETIFGCEIYIQREETYQVCLINFFDAVHCSDNRFLHVPIGSKRYSFCCTNPFCNSEETLNALIKEYLNETSTTAPSTTNVAPTTTAESITSPSEVNRQSLTSSTVVTTRTYSTSSSSICRNCNTTIATSSTNIFTDSRGIYIYIYE